jgi:hypothetical protein
MTSSRNFFFWVLSSLFAAMAIAMHYFDVALPFGWITLASGGAFDLLLVAYAVLYASYILTGD